MAMRLFSMTKGKRAKKKDGADDAGADKKLTMGALRVQVDFQELDLPHNAKLNVPDPDDLLHFEISVRPDDGLWHGGEFTFNFDVPDNYPHKPPKVKCRTLVYHPNIDLEGNVCLNILREDWKPIFTIQSILHGLLFLFAEPNDSDPLNHDAAEIMRTDYDRFVANVKSSLDGKRVEGVQFARNHV